MRTRINITRTLALLGSFCLAHAALAAGALNDLSLSQDGGSLVVKVDHAADQALDTLLVFIDADDDPATGYQSADAPKAGFDLLVSGDGLSRFTGKARDAWQWERQAPVEKATDGTTTTIRVPIRDMGLKGMLPTVGATAFLMTADWQTLEARVPAEGSTSLALKAEVADARPRPKAEMAAPKADRGLPARQRFAAAGSYYCYYGSGKVAELSHYDVAVLHTPQMASEDVKKLSDLGVVTVGYISVGEDDTLRDGDGSGPDGKASWYFDRDADKQPDKNGVWSSYYANADDPKWRADRVAEAVRLVNDYGFDGIFLDTIDTAQLYPASADGMTRLIAELREALPQGVIVLNQGWAVLKEVAQYADGIMLESFTATYDFQTKQYMMNDLQSLDYHTRRVNGLLNPVREKDPLRVLTLDYTTATDTESMQQAANRAATFGFLFAAAPIFLDDVYPPVKGEADPKWLEILATPESMSHTLEKSANGFPAGTKLVPSGTFAGYTVAPLVDGVADRMSLHWSKRAWASSEDGSSPSLEVRLGKAMRGGKLEIDWNKEDGLTPSRRFRVEAAGDTGEWSTVADVTGNDSQTVSVDLPEKAYSRLRIVQPADGGSDQRSGLMWVAQLRLKGTGE